MVGPSEAACQTTATKRITLTGNGGDGFSPWVSLRIEKIGKRFGGWGITSDSDPALLRLSGWKVGRLEGWKDTGLGRDGG
jgi:hypothetical protein